MLIPATPTTWRSLQSSQPLCFSPKLVEFPVCSQVILKSFWNSGPSFSSVCKASEWADNRPHHGFSLLCPMRLSALDLSTLVWEGKVIWSDIWILNFKQNLEISTKFWLICKTKYLRLQLSLVSAPLKTTWVKLTTISASLGGADFPPFWLLNTHYPQVEATVSSQYLLTPLASAFSLGFPTTLNALPICTASFSLSSSQLKCHLLSLPDHLV